MGNQRSLPLAWMPLFACSVVLAVCNARVNADVVEMPDYQPDTQVSGVIRVWGTPAIKSVLTAWQIGFRSYHPDTYFVNELKGSSSAMMGLEENVADIVFMGRKIVPYDTYGIWRRSHLMPREIEVATGGYGAPGKSSAIVVYVHKDNPIECLTLDQLDGIFGAQRTGGWKDMKWAPESARGENENIRTWGQLGLTGDWMAARIRPLGPPGLYPGGMSFFQIRVFGGADTWNEDLLEFADRRAMIKALEADRHAIAYTVTNFGSELVKAVSLAESGNGPYILPDRSSIADRSYPLARPVYAYFAPDYPNGDERDEVDPKLREFLRYILSRQGQEHVEKDGDYMPLTHALISQQRIRLDEPATRFKRVSP